MLTQDHITASFKTLLHHALNRPEWTYPSAYVVSEQVFVFENLLQLRVSGTTQYIRNVAYNMRSWTVFGGTLEILDPRDANVFQALCSFTLWQRYGLLEADIDQMDLSLTDVWFFGDENRFAKSFVYVKLAIS